MSTLAWRYLAFDALTAAELYAVLQLRSEVFVLEQTCMFQDMDGHDAHAMHLTGTLQGRLVAYARCFSPGFLHSEASLGRILTHRAVRGTGVGHALVDEAIVRLQQQWGPQVIRIGAQAHLEAFYRQHGFVKTAAEYVEDGIAHVQMLRYID